MSLGAQVPCLQGPISSPGAQGGGASSVVVVRGPGYGHRPAYTAPRPNP